MQTRERLCTRQRGFQLNAPGVSVLPWYLAAGLTPLAAYQPKGAASLAASYVNLINPGTFNAAPGDAPTLVAGGWSMDGASDYLTTGVIPTGSEFTIICQFTSYMVTGTDYLCGQFNGGTEVLGIFQTTTPRVGYIHGSAAVQVANNIMNGNLCVTKTAGYRDGVSEAVVVGTALTGSNELYIGARNDGGSPNLHSQVIVAAWAVYAASMTAGQVATTQTAMALI